VVRSSLQTVAATVAAAVVVATVAAMIARRSCSSRKKELVYSADDVLGIFSNLVNWFGIPDVYVYLVCLLCVVCRPNCSLFYTTVYTAPG